jgi:hypothetical protein
MEIFRNNKDVMSGPRGIEPGMKLRLPATVGNSVREVASAKVNPAPVSVQPSAQDSTKIRVKPGDTVESLAETYMGNPKFWPRIMQLNRDILKDPDDLEPGMLVRVDKIPNLAPRTSKVEKYSSVDDADGPVEESAIPVREPTSVVSAPVIVTAPVEVPAVVPVVAPIAAKPNVLQRFDELIDPSH